MEKIQRYLLSPPLLLGNYSFCSDEEKRDARVKKDEEKARRAEQKRTRQEGGRKPGDVEDVEGAELGVESEPPSLDPIPKVDPISVVEPTTEAETLQDETTSRRLPGSSSSEEPSIELTSKAEDTPAQSAPLNAETVAQRVFSAPVVDPGTQEPKQRTETTTSQPETAADVESTPKEPEVSAPTTSKESTASPAKHDEPLDSRIAPTIPVASAATPAREQPSTKTTVTAGAPSATSSKPTPKETDGKSEGRVSSWLKTKFARRSSKPAKPAISDPTPIENPSEKGFIGGAHLTGATNTSANRSDTADSEREVAMAGKPTVPATADNPNDDLYEVSPAVKPRRSFSSSSISSLSSDEDIDDVRGRNRLPREPTPMTHNLKGTLRGQPLQGAAAAEGPENVEAAASTSETRRDLRRDSTEDADEFEEARDTFDSEALPPPKNVGEGAAVGRGSDSPARDSKFHEVL